MALAFSHLLLSFLLLFSIQFFFSHSRTLSFEAKSSNFLQNLEGAQKGQTIIGLNKVKNFLDRFGYIPNNNSTNLTDDFDDILESAIKTYQKFYRLNVTGTLDSDTLKQMMVPRCGNPDIVHPKFSKPSGTHMKHGKFHLVAHYNFFPGQPKWPASKGQLTYSFLSDSANVVPSENLRSIISRGFQRWASVSKFTFQEVSSRSDSNIVVGFYSGEHGDGRPFDGSGQVLAHAFPPKDGRMHFDADENWSTSDPGSNQIDLESVAVHEIGHLLGLAHSQDPNAVMYSGIPAGVKKRMLQQDDINGIRTLYQN